MKVKNKKINILHITSQYAYTKVYKELVRNIAKNNDIFQYVYIPLRLDRLINKNKLENCPNNVEYHYQVTYNRLDRILYFTRLHKSIKNLENEINIKKINFIHAHTLFADGGLAYQLNRKYGIPYIVAVRSTDVKGYVKKMPHCLIYLNKIIKHAYKVIFISPSLQNDLEKFLTKKTKKLLRKKAIIKPNGIESFWFENINKPSEKDFKNSNKVNLVQVSELYKNKNLLATINVIQKLNKSGIEANLTVVGTGKDEEKYKKYVVKNDLRKYITFLGYISDREQLKNIYRKNDIFILLSKKETFGLVYVEAMSQGLPIIHTKGTGIDGFFENGQVGYALNLKKIDDCVYIVKKIMENYKKISKKCVECVENFNWEQIAKFYIKIYQGGESK